jgi:hypothetical protein
LHVVSVAVQGITERTAPLLVTLPAAFVTTTVCVTPLCDEFAVNVSVELVAPVMFAPLRFHWYVSPTPVAVAENVADFVALTLALTGCWVIVG